MNPGESSVQENKIRSRDRVRVVSMKGSAVQDINERNGEEKGARIRT